MSSRIKWSNKSRSNLLNRSDWKTGRQSRQGGRSKWHVNGFNRRNGTYKSMPRKFIRMGKQKMEATGFNQWISSYPNPVGVTWPIKSLLYFLDQINPPGSQNCSRPTHKPFTNGVHKTEMQPKKKPILSDLVSPSQRLAYPDRQKFSEESTFDC